MAWVFRKGNVPPFAVRVEKGGPQAIDLPKYDLTRYDDSTCLGCLFRLNERLSVNFESEKIAQSITETVREFLSVEKAVILFLNQDTKEIKIGAACGLKDESIGNYSFKNDESISGFVLLNREPLCIHDLDKEPYLKSLNREEYLKKSFLSIPIIFQNVAFGVLHACDKKDRAAFVKDDMKFLMNVGKVGAIALRNIHLNEQIQRDYLKTIAALAKAIDAKDSYTRSHSENVTRYAFGIAKEMGCKSREIEVLNQAALLHDIGKIGVGDNVLFKDGALTPEEFEQVKCHPVKGQEIIKSLSFLNDASILIRHHHEWYDGSGYPDGIKGEAIELGARILAVADAFDEMSAERVYRKQLSLEDVKKEFESKKGTQFDPAVVDIFLKIQQSL
jgi:HD-GYP domain-containing protein (c-di-GMP phosphodiesterase class II)